MIEFSDDEWNAICDRAEIEIQKLISELPSEIKNDAEKILCLLDKYSPRGNILGMHNNETPEGPIWIYLGAIYEACGKDIEATIQSVRQVYLHEFAHHFGLVEYQVKELGL